MFDAGRVLVLLWALACALRARSRLAVGMLAICAYMFGLSVASGITVREDGPLNPMMAVLLAVVGPSALPRGRLPAFPLASIALERPAIVNVVLCAALVIAARRLIGAAQHLPQFEAHTRSVGRAATALVLVAVFEGLAASLRLVPEFLEWGVQ